MHLSNAGAFEETEITICSHNFEKTWEAHSH